MSFGRWIEDEEEFSMEKKLNKSLERDNVNLFLQTVVQVGDTDESLVRGQEFLMKACEYRAYKCASALLDGEIPFIFDVNRPTPIGIFPIHHATWNRDASIIDLLLRHGARADVKAKLIADDDTPYLPLQVVLHLASYNFADFPSYESSSIFKIITLICLPRCQRTLECVELLAPRTAEVGHDFLRYVAEGKLLYIAILLAAARKTLGPAISTVLKALYPNDENPEVTPDISNVNKTELALLLLVFDTAGDELENYIKMEKKGVTLKCISKAVRNILVHSGFDVSHISTDLTPLHCPLCNLSKGEYLETSLHRWGEYKLFNECKPNKPARKHELTEEQKSKIPTAVGKRIPIAIPCSVNCNLSAADYIKNYKHRELADKDQDSY